jgi:hypothetical protein
MKRDGDEMLMGGLSGRVVLLQKMDFQLVAWIWPLRRP